MKKLGFLALLALGLTAFSLSQASVPPTGKNTSDTAIYQSNSEITTPPKGRLSFDQDLKNLNEMERRYHERLPRLSDRPELANPIKRISTRKYHPGQRAGQAAPVRKVKAVKKIKRAHNPGIIAPEERERPSR